MQRWARAYRDSVCYAAIETNNCTEALNKVLKYKYLPKQKHMTLSHVISNITSEFLPALHYKYVFKNAKQTDHTTHLLFLPICKAAPSKPFYTVYTERLLVINLSYRMYHKYLQTQATSKLTARRENILLILESSPLSHSVHARTGLYTIFHANIFLQCSNFFPSGDGKNYPAAT